MSLAVIDQVIIGMFFLVTIGIGLWVSKSASKNSTEFFLGGRNMPWWLLGVSMVATTFSADTPNLVTDIVRNNGVSGNWAWWAFLLTGMLTVFIYARLWRRSGITTDLEFYELRYSGGAATFLRGFRAVYLGVFFNVIIMATVMLAGIKIAGILLSWSPIQTVLIVGIVTVIYSSIGGFKGVIYTDFVQFIVAMIGMILACIYVINLPEIGSVQALITHPNVSDKIHLLPDMNNMEVVVPLLLIPIAVQWWSTWYPGAEPGGGGYIAQRMLSAKDERSAIKATLLFNIAHYALRPWPWILIALASLVIFPTLNDISTAFPAVSPSIVKDDLAFSAMLSLLPTGLLGMVIAALIAALMSTLSTHLNWGSSYIVHDVYQRFIDTSVTERKKVKIGQVSTVVLMILAAIFALFLENALQAFNILLQIGAGTGLLFILRWFWWRINAWSEITAMVVSFIVALVMELVIKDAIPTHYKFLIGVGITTAAWLIATWLTPPTDMKTLKQFVQLIRPHQSGWQPVIQSLHTEGIRVSDTKGQLVSGIIMMLAGSIGVYSLLFGMGYLLYGQYFLMMVAVVFFLISMLVLSKYWKHV